MEVVNIKIDELKANPKNPRKITKSELNKLIRSIKEFGFCDPVIVNKHKGRENIIVGGHMRILAAKQMKMKEVPVVYVDLPEDKEHLLNIGLNSISGQWDDQKLFDLLSELNNKGADLTLTGFDEPFIDEIIAANSDREKESMIDVAPQLPEKAKSKTGDLFKLGESFLLCGDSTKSEDMDKLMGKVQADMVFTDPPYGVSYKGTNNPNGKDWGVMQNDELRGDDLFKMLKGIYTNCARHTKANASLYSCYASVNHMIFEKTLNEAGFRIKQQLIWEKGHVLGHSDYHWSHEPIMYCCKKEQNSEWIGDRTQKTFISQATIEDLEELTKEKLIAMISKIREDSDVLKVKKDPSTEYVHATQKPVELSRMCIRNSCPPRGIVLEPCAGSGSTLIACESTKRICFCCEIEPKYVDVILTRWQAFAGKEPIRVEDGKTWTEIKAEK